MTDQPGAKLAGISQSDSKAKPLARRVPKI